MGILRVLGFVLIVVLVIGGLDFHQQFKKRDGDLSVAGYVDTIKSRFSQQRGALDAKAAEIERKKKWTAGAKSYLPAVDADWSRFELTDPDSEAVATVLSEYGPTPLISSIADPAELARLAGGGQDAILRKLAETGLVFAKGDEVAWFDISLKPESSRNSLAGIALSRQQDFMAQAVIKDGFAVIDGVGFVEIAQDLTSPKGTLEYRKIVGRIGIDEEVVIRLHTNASDGSVRKLLGALDYAALNALLTYPSPAVGQGQMVPLDRQPALAEDMDRLYAEVKRVQQKTTDEKLKNLDVVAMMVNKMTATGFESDGLMDITGGEVFENQDVLQIGYGRAQKLLIEAETGVTSLTGEGEDTATQDETAVTPDQSEPAAQTVRVHKGGLGSSCAQLGSSKTCSAIGQ